MLPYDFLCRSCDRFFSKTLTLSDRERGEINCPYCGSGDVEQGRWIAFRPLATKKSA